MSFPWAWFPWRYIVRRVARAHGFIDPMTVLSRLHRFAQPSEVAEPIELLRAGIVFHARGLMNTRAIQHNLDWVWPYWVERQFDPKDDAFIPRAFSITHVNLTHRNWTAVGLPDCELMPIVDPRGLITPDWDGWSIDGWVIARDGRELIPSRVATVSQRLEMTEGLAVVTDSVDGKLRVGSRVEVDWSGGPRCCMEFVGQCDTPAWLVIALRPYNPEGVSFLHDVVWDGTHWSIDGRKRVRFSTRPDRHVSSNYHRGDVHVRLRTDSTDSGTQCDVGLTTAAGLFELTANEPRSVQLTVALREERDAARHDSFVSWRDAMQGTCRLEVPDKRFVELYEAALRTLILHSPGEVFPGPYTYKRFWFRDAAFILNAMLAVGMERRVERAIDRFPSHQTHSGYFRSQDGEWDSNGEALWTMQRFCEVTGGKLKPEWRSAVLTGAQWIIDKRLPDEPASEHAGLMPPGFSAEHLGPNNYYYWDDFWSVAGLRSAVQLLDGHARREVAEFARTADLLMAAIDRSLEASSSRRSRPGMPAAPYRRIDSGAIGSLAVSYPLQLWPAHDARVLDTAEFLMSRCFVDGGFFQDMIHSGINPYLTLQVAQVLLRAGRPDFFELVETVARLASPTGQWPEAIHPRTLGGCMGDGQHAWAAAEWVLMMRHMFVREEQDRLILGSGIPASWLAQPEPLSFGPATTRYGRIAVRIECGGNPRVNYEWLDSGAGRPRHTDAVIEVQLPAYSGGQTVKTANARGDADRFDGREAGSHDASERTGRERWR